MISTETIRKIVHEAETHGPEGHCFGAFVLSAQRYLRGSSSGTLTTAEWDELMACLASGGQSSSQAGFALQ